MAKHNKYHPRANIANGPFPRPPQTCKPQSLQAFFYYTFVTFPKPAPVGETAYEHPNGIRTATKRGVQTIWAALDAYKTRLQSSIARTQRRLAQFEQKYAVTTAEFLAEMTAEDLEEGDMEYVAWAGEAHLLDGLQRELGELEYVHNQLSPPLPQADHKHTAVGILLCTPPTLRQVLDEVHRIFPPHPTTSPSVC